MSFQLLSRSDSELCGREDGGLENEALDPRVQAELDSLNVCAEDINQLENGHEEAGAVFRTLLSDSTQQLRALSKKVGGCNIDRARPYFEALETYRGAQRDCRDAAAFQVKQTLAPSTPFEWTPVWRCPDTLCLAGEDFLICLSRKLSHHRNAPNPMGP